MTCDVFAAAHFSYFLLRTPGSSIGNALFEFGVCLVCAWLTSDILTPTPDPRFTEGES